jgi:hypothetical protein
MPSAARGERRHRIVPAKGSNREGGAPESRRVHLPSVVARLGETQYPDAYGGLTARLTGPDESRAIKMTIYVAATGAGPFLAAVHEQSAQSPDTHYTVVRVPHTWAELNALALKIEDAKDQWRARGVHLSAADPDAPASKVIVTLLAYSTAAANALTAAYGHDWISVVPSPARYIPLGNDRCPGDAINPCWNDGTRRTSGATH